MSYKITEKVGEISITYEAPTVEEAHRLANHDKQQDLTECSVVELLQTLRKKASLEGGYLSLDTISREGGSYYCDSEITLRCKSLGFEEAGRIRG